MLRSVLEIETLSCGVVRNGVILIDILNSLWPFQAVSNCNALKPIVTPLVLGLKHWFVTKTVRVPEPIFEEIVRESERQDVARGIVVKEWMKKAKKYDEVEERHR